MNSKKMIGIGLIGLALLIGLIVLPIALGLAALGGGEQKASSDEDLSGDCGGQLSGTPKEIIDKQVLPLAHKIDFKQVTPQSVEAANAAHGPTVSGGRSDHQGPPDQAWAADISNGSSPTPEMDKLADELAKCYGIKWSGSGLVNGPKDGYRIQLIYRTNQGGNHYNHVHIGVRKGG